MIRAAAGVLVLSLLAPAANAESDPAMTRRLAALRALAIPTAPPTSRVSLHRAAPTCRPRHDAARTTHAIRDAALRFGVDPKLIRSVIREESAGDPDALSHKGAQGLMQLMPQTAQYLRVSDAYDAQQNVEGGTRYLARMVERYGDWSRALAAYNAGPDAVDRYRGIPPYQETREYVRRVLSYYRRYDAEFAE